MVNCNQQQTWPSVRFHRDSYSLRLRPPLKHRKRYAIVSSLESSNWPKTKVFLESTCADDPKSGVKIKLEQDEQDEQDDLFPGLFPFWALFSRWYVFPIYWWILIIRAIHAFYMKSVLWLPEGQVFLRNCQSESEIFLTYAYFFRLDLLFIQTWEMTLLRVWDFIVHIWS